jgi:hypothetical protein
LEVDPNDGLVFRSLLCEGKKNSKEEAFAFATWPFVLFFFFFLLSPFSLSFYLAWMWEFIATTTPMIRIVATTTIIIITSNSN